MEKAPNSVRPQERVKYWNRAHIRTPMVLRIGEE